MITETEDLAALIDAAAQHWPTAAQDRKQLLRLLIETGSAAIRGEDEERQREHRESVRRHAGMFSGIYDADELARLRQDWPE